MSADNILRLAVRLSVASGRAPVNITNDGGVLLGLDTLSRGALDWSLIRPSITANRRLLISSSKASARGDGYIDGGGYSCSLNFQPQEADLASPKIKPLISVGN